MSKASKRRFCPALGREITPVDCGEQRQSSLPCPEDCAHNPFAPPNYSQLLEIENRLDNKTMEKFEALTPDHSWLENDLALAEQKSIHAVHALYAWNLFFATDKDDSTFFERWEGIGLEGLKNDERVLLRGKAGIRIALLEIHRVFGDGLMEAVDLLSPEQPPFILLDRSLARVAMRFTTLVAWIFPLPHYWRLSGTAVGIPDMAQFTAPEIVSEIVRHLGGPPGEPEMRRWLAEHFDEFGTALDAVAKLRRHRMMVGMDARYGKAVYELRALYAQCRKRLDALPDVSREDLSEDERDEGFVEGRVWFDNAATTKQPVLPGGQAVLGRVLLGQKEWRLEALGSERLTRLRRQFETQMGERVGFSRERIDDLGVQLSAMSGPMDESLAPPRLLETAEKMIVSSSRSPALPPRVSPEDAENEMMRAAEREFLEDKIPALGGSTPREAARDPALRPKLVQLMKQRVRLHDERNLDRGLTDDINWMLLELDLGELIFEPPPERAPAERSHQDDDEFPGQWDSGEMSTPGALRPPPPPLPLAPFDLEEAIERLEAGINAFETAEEAEVEIYASGSSILDDAADLMLEYMTEDEFCLVVPFVMQTWFALVPPRCSAPEIGPRELERAFIRNLERFGSGIAIKSPKELESFINAEPQPSLIMVLMSAVLEASKAVPKRLRPSGGAQATILVLLVSLVEILDKALRPR